MVTGTPETPLRAFSHFEGEGKTKLVFLSRIYVYTYMVTYVPEIDLRAFS